MKLWKLSVVLLLGGLLAFRMAGIELEKRALMGNRIELKIPKGFVAMSEDMEKLKYPAGRRPTLVYTNENGSVSLALNFTNSRATQAQLPVDKDNLLYTYRHQYTGAREKWNGIQAVNGRKVGFIEFGELDSEAGKYTLIFFTDFHGQLLICTVACTDQNIAQWKPAAKEMMASLKLK
ncbi:MAG: hypothetical protein M3Y12_04880 [Bacteroidota bacterium]|nr:hypothetical protein [Bacteroidota bacterium]